MLKKIVESEKRSRVRIKNRKNDRVDIHIPTNTVAIGPRNTTGTPKKDLATNKKLKGLTSRRILNLKIEKDDAEKPEKKEKDDGKKKGK